LPTERSAASGVFDVDIGQNLRVDTELLAESQGFVGLALDDALIRNYRTGVDVDPNVVGVDDCGDRERRLGVVPQDVDADGAVDSLANRSPNACHRGDGVFRHAVGVERGVTVVFDHEAVDAACG